MKHRIFIPIWLAVMFISLNTFAQRSIEEIAVPLTNPNKPGKLKVDIKTGHITVTGYDGDVVLVQIHPYGKKDKSSKDSKGLTRIPNQSMDVDIREVDNFVDIQTSNWNKRIDFVIQVPRKFALHLKTFNSGKINVDNVEGEVDANNYNGPIYLKNISGLASATTYNGEIEVHFNRIDADKPMAFSTYNGHIETRFPEGIRATTKIKTQQGEILTDFDMEIEKAAPIVDNRENEGGVYKLKIDNWVIGKINGGGPEFLFKNYNGDIVIRKEE